MIFSPSTQAKVAMVRLIKNLPQKELQDTLSFSQGKNTASWYWMFRYYPTVAVTIAEPGGGWWFPLQADVVEP
jgi:hypothetical protein